MLEMEASAYFEKLVTCHIVTRCHGSEYHDLHELLCSLNITNGRQLFHWFNFCNRTDISYRGCSILCSSFESFYTNTHTVASQ